MFYKIFKQLDDKFMAMFSEHGPVLKVSGPLLKSVVTCAK
jgi:hypothetical protein